MKSPRLKSVSNPNGPEWAEVIATPQELDALQMALALIVAPAQPGSLQILGSGFVLHYDRLVYVITAAHVLLGYARQRVGAPRGGVPGDIEDELREEAKRLQRITSANPFGVVLQTTRGALLLEVQAGSTALDERGHDIAILQCALPERISDLSLPLHPPDWSEVAAGTKTIMVGFAPPVGLTLDLGNWEQVAIDLRRRYLVARCGYIREVTDRAEGARKGVLLYRANMPSDPGMSGGPVLMPRSPPWGEQPSGPDGGPATLVSLGVISRNRPGGTFLEYFENPDGETWVVPIGHLLGMKVVAPAGVTDVSELADGPLLSYQDIAAHLESLPALREGETYQHTFDFERLRRAKAERRRVKSAEQLIPPR